MHKKSRLISAAIFGCLAGIAGSVSVAQQPPAASPVVGSAADNTTINERDKSSQTLKPTDQPNNSADINLAAAVRSAIVKDKSLSTTAHNVKLIAASGVVTLRGPVTSEDEKTKVGRCVASVTGVSHVENQLDIKPN